MNPKASSDVLLSRLVKKTCYTITANKPKTPQTSLCHHGQINLIGDHEEQITLYALRYIRFVQSDLPKETKSRQFVVLCLAQGHFDMRCWGSHHQPYNKWSTASFQCNVLVYIYYNKQNRASRSDNKPGLTLRPWLCQLILCFSAVYF